MQLEYNTSRPNLSIMEYGRNIQKMIQYAITIEDREERNLAAQSIVRAMAQLTTQSKDAADFWKKIWSHLFILSDFKLDVDSPYPKPENDTIHLKPSPISYPSSTINFRYYGKNIQQIIKKITTLEDGAKKNALVKQVANQLKKSYLNWNRDSVTDEIIIAHLAHLSDNMLTLDQSERLSKTRDLLVVQKKSKHISNKNGSKFSKPKRGGFSKY